jgi:penicillin-binding protein 2
LRSSHNNPLDDSHYRGGAARYLLFFVLAAMTVLSLRLLHLQVIQGGYHKSLSEQNSIRLQVVKAPRGLVYDRNGIVIARNRPSYQIAIQPTELQAGEPILPRLLRFRDSAGKRLFDSAHVAWSLDRARWRRFQPLIILEDAPAEVVALIEEHQTDLPGVVTLVESRRNYPFGSAAGHVLGYMDEVKEEEVGTLGHAGGAVGPADSLLPYARGDRIGRKGLERQYERHFRGRDGIRYVKVNAFGKQMEVIESMARREPEPGLNIYTTLDMNLQVMAESLLTDSMRGAVVVLDPRTGEVLAMASSPRLDGNVFSLSRERRAKEWARLALDPARPLHNRALNGGYEPASTFKGVVSLAGYEAGVNPHAHMARGCNGGYQFGNRRWRCWEEKGHGSTNAFTAFMMSCDVYYYQLGLMIGMDRINAVARRFGFGQKSGIDLEDDRSGLLMDSTTYERMYGKRGWRWSRGLILNLSIGQGQIATPLQLANYVAGMANGKAIYRPHFLREVRDPRGRLVSAARPEVLHKLNLSPGEHDLIIKSLSEVVNGVRGTGSRAKVPGVWVGGKSGSAENPHGKLTHALFVAAAPLDNPQIAVAVVLENAGGGGAKAAPIAGALMKRYLGPQPDSAAHTVPSAYSTSTPVVKP